MLVMLVLLSSFPLHFYEVFVPINLVFLLLESPDRIHPSFSWMHLYLLSKTSEAELDNAIAYLEILDPPLKFCF